MRGDALSRAAGEISLMAYFPASEDSRLALMRVLARMVDTEEHLQWLVNRMVSLYTRWPGIGEMRALYCSRFKPRDGIEAYSTTYPKGYPDESKTITPLPQKRERVTTADTSLNDALQEIAKGKDMNRRTP